ncbi:MAG: hypothetical protein ACYTBJ_11630 [Planctomycetota bacterium]
MCRRRCSVVSGVLLMVVAGGGQIVQLWGGSVCRSLNAGSVWISFDRGIGRIHNLQVGFERILVI